MQDRFLRCVTCLTRDLSASWRVRLSALLQPWYRLQEHIVLETGRFAVYERRDGL